MALKENSEAKPLSAASLRGGPYTGGGVGLPHLVPVHGRDEEGEGDSGGCHGVGRWHSILSNHSLLQFHDGWGGGAGPLQDILGHLTNIHDQLQNQRTNKVSLTK